MIHYRLAMLLLPTFEGDASKNNIFYAVAKRTSPHYAGVRFQERVEAAWARMLSVPFLLLAFAAVWLLGLDPAFYLIAFMVWAILAVVVTTQVPLFVEWAELRGQSVESYIRHRWYGEPLDEAELANARQLTSPYNQYRKKGAFSKETEGSVKVMLEGQRDWAARLCESQRDKIQAYYEMGPR